MLSPLTYILLYLSVTLVASYTNISLAARRPGFSKCAFQFSINKNNGPNFHLCYGPLVSVRG